MKQREKRTCINLSTAVRRFSYSTGASSSVVVEKEFFVLLSIKLAYVLHENVIQKLFHLSIFNQF